MRRLMRWLLRIRLSRASFAETEVGRRLGRKRVAEQTLLRLGESDRARGAFTASRGLTTAQACCHVTTSSASRVDSRLLSRASRLPRRSDTHSLFLFKRILHSLYDYIRHLTYLRN